jgi:hypothetical protein
MYLFLNCPHCQSKLQLERPNEPIKSGCPACGNSFTVDPANVPQQDQMPGNPKKTKESVSGWVVAGYIFAVLGGYLGLGIAIGLLNGEKKNKKHGIYILILSIIFMVFWRVANK